MSMKKIIVHLGLFICLSISVLFHPSSAFAVIKKITVNIASQSLAAWEDNTVVYSTAVSTGLPQTPTVRGTFNIYAKVPSQRMSGGSAAYGYYDLPNVPHVMYFYQGYSIHGAYWHNNFGTPMSHGCVNAPLDAAAWLYNWAPMGTQVAIY